MTPRRWFGTMLPSHNLVREPCQPHHEDTACMHARHHRGVPLLLVAFDLMRWTPSTTGDERWQRAVNWEEGGC